MPELPEVELAARRLREWLVGCRVTHVETDDALLLRGASAADWHAALAGRCGRAVRRRAKYLLADFEGGHTLVAHLRMTGRFLRESGDAAPPPGARLFLRLEDGSRLTFQDRRRLGQAWVLPTPAVESLPQLASLGPDTLEEPPSAPALMALTCGRRQSIKALLMDQRRLSGLGNICAGEILFRARIAPEMPAGQLSEAEIARLAELIPEYLRWAIEAQSRHDPVYLGERGAVNVFSLYGRRGEPCPACGEAIRRTVIAGRGTYYCPRCQG
ncbi:MAG: bifunctional DNA-formamidopyrimidine glycosylase/DNA-(apurinic or apyrimidinic site) lyase [Armatimonadetes bacterium]|nr:bifunctional DNA-formamidopyrimidine glycosylase/DNA-(apurinic or apyrimidinic site) lyase [Armatimonadota bacterium]